MPPERPGSTGAAIDTRAYSPRSRGREDRHLSPFFHLHLQVASGVTKSTFVVSGVSSNSLLNAQNEVRKLRSRNCDAKRHGVGDNERTNKLPPDDVLEAPKQAELEPADNSTGGVQLNKLIRPHVCQENNCHTIGGKGLHVASFVRHFSRKNTPVGKVRRHLLTSMNPMAIATKDKTIPINLLSGRENNRPECGRQILRFMWMNMWMR